MEYLKVIDISRWQPSEDLDYAKFVEVDDIKAVAVRFSVSDYYQDAERFNHYQGFKDQGVPVIGYHVNRPKQNIDASLRNFEDAIGGVELDGVVLDSELSKDSRGVLQPRSIIAQDCYEHAVAISEMHENAFLYTRKSWWDQFVGIESWSPRLLRAWMAHYYWPWVTEPWLCTSYQNAGKEWEIWQWTDKGTLEGTPHHVDIDWMKKKFFDECFGEQAPPPPPAPSPITITLEVPTGTNVIIEEI